MVRGKTRKWSNEADSSLSETFVTDNQPFWYFSKPLYTTIHPSTMNSSANKLTTRYVKCSIFLLSNNWTPNHLTCFTPVYFPSHGISCFCSVQTALFVLGSLVRFHFHQSIVLHISTNRILFHSCPSIIFKSISISSSIKIIIGNND